MLARRLLHSPRRKSFPCILLRTLCRTLRSFFAPRPFFSITSTLFLQNTGVAYLCAGSAPSASRRYHLRLLLSPFSSRLAPLLDRSSMLFRINTCKSVSKQTTLTSFRINTYEKHGEGEGAVAGDFSRHSPLALATFLPPFVFILLRIAFPASPFFSQSSALPPGGGVRFPVAQPFLAVKERRGLSTLASRHFPPQNKRAMYSRIWCFQYGQSCPPCGPQLSREWRMPFAARTSERRYEGPEFSHGPVPVAM